MLKSSATDRLLDVRWHVPSSPAGQRDRKRTAGASLGVQAHRPRSRADTEERFVGDQRMAAVDTVPSPLSSTCSTRAAVPAASNPPNGSSVSGRPSSPRAGRGHAALRYFASAMQKIPYANSPIAMTHSITLPQVVSASSIKAPDGPLAVVDRNAIAA